MELILALAVVFYYSLLARFLVGLRKLEEIDKNRTPEKPFVSVVVAARNEEEFVGECLHSILRQTYPGDKFEVILANDRSTDRTGEIATDLAAKESRLSTFVVTETPALRGKSNALAQAIDRAKGEVVMMTDADCRVPPTWIEGIVSRFLPNVGIIGSATVQEAHTAWGGMQSLDWTYLHGIASATIALNDPLSVIGNNLSFRKKAYDQVGGYRGIKFSVTEDFQLFKHIIASGEWKYRFPLDPAVTVMSKPCPDLKTLIRQKHRWAKGGLDMKLSGLFLMFTGFLMHGAILYGAATWWFAESMLVLLLKFIGDYVYLRKVLSKLGRLEDVKHFWAFEAYYASYLVILPFKVLFGGEGALERKIVLSFSLPEIFSLIFLYAATDYKFKYFVSYLRKKTADIVTDIPYRVGPGVDIPLLFLAHDPSKYPFTLRKLTAEIFASGKKISAVDLVASSQQFSKPMAWQVFYIPRPAVSGWVEITVSFEIEERGKNRIYVADNYRISSGAPFRVYLSDYTYPLYDGYIGGDVHTHSDLTNDQVEFGAPFEASIELARALELGFFCVTDHSYDLDDEPGNFLQNDPAIPKWLSLHQRIDRLNSSSHPVTVVRGEEATCRNERGKNVHLLLFGGRTFVPGSGDGAEKWLRTKSEHSIAEAIARGDAPVRVSAHPFEPVHILQQYLLGRSEWTLNDLRTKGMSGMQIFNGIRTVSSLRAMKAWTHLLLEGKKFFAFAGTDAHGNFNRFRQVYVPFVWIQEHHHQLFGSFRTVVALTHDSEREQDILNAFSRGESYITDGPAVEMNVRKPSGAITRMGGALTSSSVTVEVRALSSPEFGTIERLLLYVGDISLKKEKMISILQPREPQCGLEVYHQLNIEHHCYVRCEVVTSAQNDFDKKPHFCYSNPIWITPA